MEVSVRVNALAVLVAILAAPTTPVAAQTIELAGHLRSGEVTIDGAASEWNGLLAPLTEPKVSIGVVNDGDTVFVCLTASDLRTRQQILRLGLVVWFDPGGGTKKVFGIKFPVGSPVTSGVRSETRPRGGVQSTAPEAIEIVNRLEILGSDRNDRRSLVLGQTPGISVRVGQAEGLLVYELSVPLARTADHPYAIGAKAGSVIGIGLATPDAEKGTIAAGGGQPRAGFGGVGGMGGMSGGGMGGMPPAMSRDGLQALKPMKTWLKVQLPASATYDR